MWSFLFYKLQSRKKIFFPFSFSPPIWKNHENTQKKLLDNKTGISTSEKTWPWNDLTNIILRIFSVQLDFTPRCISISKVKNLESRTSAASEMKFFVIIFYSFKPLTIFIENSVLEAVRVLDLPLIMPRLLMTSNKLIFCRLNTK